MALTPSGASRGAVVGSSCAVRWLCQSAPARLNRSGIHCSDSSSGGALRGGRGSSGSLTGGVCFGGALAGRAAGVWLAAGADDVWLGVGAAVSVDGGVVGSGGAPAS